MNRWGFVNRIIILVINHIMVFVVKSLIDKFFQSSENNIEILMSNNAFNYLKLNKIFPLLSHTRYQNEAQHNPWINFLFISMMIQTFIFSFYYFISGNSEYIMRFLWCVLNYFSIHITDYHQMLSILTLLNILNTDSWIFGFCNIFFFLLHITFIKTYNVQGKVSQQRLISKSSNILIDFINDFIQKFMNNIKRNPQSIEQAVDLCKSKILNSENIDLCKEKSMEIINHVIDRVKNEQVLHDKVKSITTQYVDHTLQQKDRVLMFVKEEFEKVMQDEEKKKQITQYLQEKTKYVVDETHLMDMVVDPLVHQVKQRIKQLL